MSKDQKNIMYAIITMLLIALVIYFLGRRSVRKQSPKDVKLPPDVQGDNVPANWNPGPYTDALKSDIYTWGPRSLEPYTDALALSNSQIVAIHNDWNNRYFTKDDETLRTAIEDEFYINRAQKAAADTLVERLKSLGL